jgi:hypothetical protein
MFRVLLVVALLAVPAHGAPRLKDRKPVPDPEAARIAALRARYDQIQQSGTREERMNLARAKVRVLVAMGVLDDLARAPGLPNRDELRRAMEQELTADSIVQDLFDIATHDRKKAAGKK